MRVLLVAAVVFIAALAGCAGKKGGDDPDHLTYTCSNGTVISEEDYEDVLDNVTVDFLKTKCPKGTGTGTGTGSNGNGTNSAVPNLLPILMMNVTDFGGNATMITLLDGNLTFSAAGSSDPDGTISAIAISVTDSNTTRTKSLYNAATSTFTPVTFSFDRAGPVNVSVQMVDDRAGFNGSLFQVFVNQEFTISQTGKNPEPTGNAAVAHPCNGAKEGPLAESGPVLDNSYWHRGTVTVSAPAGFIEAIPLNTRTLVTICDPANTPISDPVKSPNPVITTNTEPLPLPATGTDNYAVGLYASTGAPNTEVSVKVIVHYEPKPVAPAA